MPINISQSNLSSQNINAFKEAAKKGELTKDKVIEIVSKDGIIDENKEQFLKNLKAEKKLAIQVKTILLK